MRWFVVALLCVVSAASVRGASPGMAAPRPGAAVQGIAFQDTVAAPQEGAVAPDTVAVPQEGAVAADSLAAPVDTTVAHRAAPPQVDALAQVVGLEERRRAAMVAADTHTLSGIIAEDATYVHSTGIMQTRDELFRLLENKTIRYLSFDVEKTSYRVYGDTIVGTGVQKIGVMSGGKSLVVRSRYTVLYTMRAGTEQLIAYQSTPLPEMATKTK